MLMILGTGLIFSNIKLLNIFILPIEDFSQWILVINNSGLFPLLNNMKNSLTKVTV